MKRNNLEKERRREGRKKMQKVLSGIKEMYLRAETVSDTPGFKKATFLNWFPHLDTLNTVLYVPCKSTSLSLTTSRISDITVSLCIYYCLMLGMQPVSVCMDLPVILYRITTLSMSNDH